MPWYELYIFVKGTSTWYVHYQDHGNVPIQEDVTTVILYIKRYITLIKCSIFHHKGCTQFPAKPKAVVKAELSGSGGELWVAHPFAAIILWVISGFTWLMYPYSPGLLHCQSYGCRSARDVILKHTRKTDEDYFSSLHQFTECDLGYWQTCRY